MAAVSLWAVALLVLLPGLILQSDGARLSVPLAAQGVVLAHTGVALIRVLTATTVRLTALGFWVFAYVSLASLASATDHLLGLLPNRSGTAQPPWP
ncbi:hypothetical protein [Streptomyces canarius]